MDSISYTNWVKESLRNGSDSDGKAFITLCMGAIGETGEVADKIKRLYRGDIPAPTQMDLMKEVGDALWYMTALAVLYHADIEGFDDTKSDSQTIVKGRAAEAVSQLALEVALFTSKYEGCFINETAPAGVSEIDVRGMLAKVQTLSSALGFSMKEVRKANYDKLTDRRARNASLGSGDDR